MQPYMSDIQQPYAKLYNYALHFLSPPLEDGFIPKTRTWHILQKDGTIVEKQYRHTALYTLLKRLLQLLFFPITLGLLVFTKKFIKKIYHQKNWNYLTKTQKKIIEKGLKTFSILEKKSSSYVQHTPTKIPLVEAIYIHRNIQNHPQIELYQEIRELKYAFDAHYRCFHDYNFFTEKFSDWEYKKRQSVFIEVVLGHCIEKKKLKMLGDLQEHDFALSIDWKSALYQGNLGINVSQEIRVQAYTAIHELLKEMQSFFVPDNATLLSFSGMLLCLDRQKRETAAMEQYLYTLLQQQYNLSIEVHKHIANAYSEAITLLGGRCYLYTIQSIFSRYKDYTKMLKNQWLKEAGRIEKKVILVPKNFSKDSGNGESYGFFYSEHWINNYAEHTDLASTVAMCLILAHKFHHPICIYGEALTPWQFIPLDKGIIQPSIVVQPNFATKKPPVRLYQSCDKQWHVITSLKK